MKHNHIKFEYDGEVDAAYLRLARGKVRESEEVQPGLIVDYGAGDRIIGVEILSFARRFRRQLRPTKKLAG